MPAESITFWCLMFEESENEDISFWNEAVKGVKKSVQPNIDLGTSPRRISSKKEREQTVLYQNHQHTPSLNTTADIDKQTMRRFKRGEFGIEGTLDLHGFTQDAAYAAVKRFIISSYLQNKRAILIITGKGLPHENEDIFASHGVLKDLVPRWLQTDELSPLILSYIHPNVKLGGTGALYILLRRQKHT